MATRRKRSADSGAAEVEATLHDAQEQGYLGQRPDNAPSFASQTVAGVLAGDNVDESETPELGAQAGGEAEQS